VQHRGVAMSRGLSKKRKTRGFEPAGITPPLFVAQAAATDKGDRQAAAAVLMQNWRTRGASAEAV
jgi:hypothetical protein